MSVLAEKLQAALAAKQAVETKEPEPVRRGKRVHTGQIKKVKALLKQRGGRGLTSNELANELGIDVTRASAALGGVHGKFAYRQATNDNHGPAGGARFRYFYMETQDKMNKPKPANVVPPADWPVEDDDDGPWEDRDTPDIHLKPTFKLETRKTYFMVLSNGKEVEITLDQYKALGGVF